MPIYRLDPDNDGLGDRSWEASTLKDSCWVRADNEDDARRKVEGATIRMVDVVQGRPVVFSLWLSNSLTHCYLDIPALDIPEGIVVGAIGPHPKRSTLFPCQSPRLTTKRIVNPPVITPSRAEPEGACWPKSPRTDRRASRSGPRSAVFSFQAVSFGGIKKGCCARSIGEPGCDVFENQFS